MLGVEIAANLYAGFGTDHPSSPSSWNVWERIDEAAWPATDRAAQPEIGPLFQPAGQLEWQRDRNRRRDRFSTAEWCRRNDRKGRLIRHARPARGVAGTAAAGRDDRAGLPDSADGGGWPPGVAGVGLRCGTPGCNSTARDRSACKSRTPPGIPGRDKPAAGEPLLHEPPSAHSRRALTMATDHARVEPALMVTSHEGCQARTPLLRTAGFFTAFQATIQFSLKCFDADD